MGGAASCAAERSGTLLAARAAPTCESVRPRLVDWLVTPLFLLGFAGTLLVFDPLLRIASAFGLRPQEFVAGLLQVVLLGVFRLAGTRIHVERDPAVRGGVPYL